MTTGVHDDEPLPEPARALLDASARLAPAWLARVTRAAAARGGTPILPDDVELVEIVDAAVSELVTDLAALLASDVDEQRTNPLSLFRASVAGPTRFLLARGARPPAADRFAADHFPEDVFGLGPAAWSDIDPDLHEPGITWGAWKAMTVLRRRREEGLR